VDDERPKNAATSIRVDGDTFLERLVAEEAAEHPGLSGFVPLADGIDALGARLTLIDRAERSIDAQYYFILNDVTGHLFISRLLAAADRGVRVRLLVDDIATRSLDVGMSQLDAHPNFEIRIFNPFSRRLGRFLHFVMNFRRANRRMHNKSFSVDGIATVVGGRNIGAEYFAAREDVNFGDLDLLGFGPVARDVGVAFDTYWDDALATPIADLVRPPRDPDTALESLRERIAESLEGLETSDYGEALRSTLLDRLQGMDGGVEWAPAHVVFDPPGKIRGEVEPGEIAERLAISLLHAIGSAERELLVVSPYFVPLEGGVELLGAAQSRGVRSVILTNSLASSDVVAVHSGYTPFRLPLLRHGVELFESCNDARMTGPARAGAALSRSSLHAKIFVVDQRKLFVGSFNWDPRSVSINTEMGILVDSPELARRVAALILSLLPSATWRVGMAESGALRWSRTEAGREIVATREPGASFWRRLLAAILRWLPIREQL
jgi:putative cardiolipin synthase